LHRRVIAAVAVVLFAVLAVMVAIVTDLHDRSFPQALGAKSLVALDISGSGLSDEDVFRQLGTLSDRWGLGLVKRAPDLSGDQSGQVFVPLGDQDRFPGKIQRFGDQPDALIRATAVLEHSFATGDYLITGDTTHLADFQTWLTTHRIGNKWVGDTLGGTVMLVVTEASFAVTLLAVIALMVALVLYWLSVKARGRALRVLAGVSTWRIQYEDLGVFLTAMLSAAVVCDVIAVLYVGLAQGWVFVPYYALTLAAFGGVVALMTMICAVVMSLASWPSAKMLALREPAVTSLRNTSVVLKVATFTLVLAAVGPAVTAYSGAKDAAAQQAVWKSLADQAVLTFPGALGEDGFKDVMGSVGAVVKDAEERDSVALSYAWTQGNNLDGVDFGPDRNLALVNQRWLDLVLNKGEGSVGGNQPQPGLVPLSLDQVPQSVKQYIGPSLELWTRHRLSAAAGLAKLSFYRYQGPTKVPLSVGGSGDLAFVDHSIIMVAPSLADLFNDGFLASAASSRNVVFTGLGPTMALVNQHGLSNKVFVKYVAEEGVLQAQFSAYFAWLKAISLVALVVALVLSALIGALITAMMKARRDFLLRAAGKPWSEILTGRVAQEWVAGAVLTIVVILFQGLQGAALVALVAVSALLISPLTHLVAARWSFTNVSLRKV